MNQQKTTMNTNEIIDLHWSNELVTDKQLWHTAESSITKKELRKVLKLHRHVSMNTYAEDCFCWYIDILLMEKEKSLGLK